ncbi:MAG: tyrosine-type recombinase/integrase [Thermoguttaceae bacterium]|jgi:integrase
MAKVRLFQASHELKRLGPETCPWSVQWRENGRRCTKTIGSKDDAAEFATLKEAELLSKAKGINTQKRWADFVEEYLQTEAKASGKRPATVDIIDRALARFTEKLRPTWVHLIDARALDTFRQLRLKDKGDKGPISPHTVLKDLRHLHAALGVAKRWGYLREVPDMPRIATDSREKPHVTEEHFLAIMGVVDIATLPDPRVHDLPESVTSGDWWRALLMTCWVTGGRIGAVLRFRWEDVDFDAARVLSRAADLKQRKDTRPEIRGALPYLEKVRGSDPRLLPWNHNKRTLYTEFARIQTAAGVDLPCSKEGSPGHECTPACHLYGFHSFRYAHARYNYQNPDLQNQMGHATPATTEHYRKWAKRQLAEYNAYVPDLAGQQQNGNKTSNKPEFRVVG